MASKDGKGKKTDRKSAKKSEESPPLEEKKEDCTPDIGIDEQTPDMEEIVTEEPPRDPTPEPVYDEPFLSELIVEKYSGEKVRGLYDGEATAHFTGGHVYQGQFSQGLMHGKGSYSWFDGLSYEGDFVKNQIAGRGAYRWPDGSSYEGEVMEGKRHGGGIFRATSGMFYSGRWCLGKRDGKGRMEYDAEGKSYYDGEWVKNIRHGYGTRQYTSGNIYQGMWFNNVRHGEGTMKWLDKDQIYTGQWENGIQHGIGQHIWLLQRITGSQYPLRNMYDGDFVAGLRHGLGTFFYANGSKYEGGWKNNMKQGKGKFTFKNGRIYEGLFEKDHIVEYPDFAIDGMNTPDLSMIRTRTPLPLETMSVHSNESKNTISPSFQLEIDAVLEEFTEIDREEETNQVLYVIMRYTTVLKKIYNFYSGLGHEESPDNTYIMNKMQFWRFLQDCHFHHGGLTLMDMDRLVGHGRARIELHNPYERILQRQFVNNIVILAYYIYGEEHEGTSPILSWCFSRLISDNILRHACVVKGHFYYETRRAINALIHLDQAYTVYQQFASPRKHVPREPVLKMRQFLHLMNDFCLINEDLTAKAVIDILKTDDPNVADNEGCCNLELEMTFLEFFEALIGCAEVFVTENVVKDPTTPRPSTAITVEQSMCSIPATPSRGAISQGEDNLELGVTRLSPRRAVTPETGSPIGRGSSVTDNKPPENHQSAASNAMASSSETGQRTESHHSSSRHPHDLHTIDEHHKSGSLVSSQTNATEENATLAQSGASLTEAAEGREDDERMVTIEDEEEEDLDEATRRFNFWTHQVHIFFVRKFFPSAENMIGIKYRVDRRKFKEAKHKLMQEQTSTRTPDAV